MGIITIHIAYTAFQPTKEGDFIAFVQPPDNGHVLRMRDFVCAETPEGLIIEARPWGDPPAVKADGYLDLRRARVCSPLWAPWDRTGGSAIAPRPGDVMSVDIEWGKPDA